MSKCVVRINKFLLYALTDIFLQDIVCEGIWREKVLKRTYGISLDTSLRGKTASFEAVLSTVHRVHGALELGCCAG
jgi:hypothetical protein